MSELQRPPLSRMDLPGIIEGIRILYRVIETPPGTGDEPPDWLVSHHLEKTSAGAEGRPLTWPRSHSGLISAAADEVLDRMMPPWHHRCDDCPQITESQLEMRHKVSLLKLRDDLLMFAVGKRLADNRAVAVQFCASLEEVLATLTDRGGCTTPPPAATPAGPESGGEGTLPTIATNRGTAGGRKKRIPLAEANVLVRDWLAANAKNDPAAITRDGVAAGTGVSTGQVSKTAAWKAFSERRAADAKPGAREVPLTDAMQAVVPGDCKTPDELAALIEEQRADEAKDTRRHKRRHKPS